HGQHDGAPRRERHRSRWHPVRVDDIRIPRRATGGAHEGGEKERQRDDEPRTPAQIPGDARAVRDAEVAERRRRHDFHHDAALAPISSINRPAGPSGGTAARMGRSAATYSNTLPGMTPVPRPPASAAIRSKASESRWSSSERRRGTNGITSTRSPSPSDSANSRSAARNPPTKRTTTSSSSDSASARRNGF